MQEKYNIRQQNLNQPFVMYRLKSIASAVVLVVCSLFARADWDLWQSYIIINNTYYGGPSNPDLAPAFGNLYLGAFSTGGSMPLNGGELKTFKNCTGGCSNVCGADLFYRVYRTCDSAPAFSTLSLPFDSDLSGGDQKWDATGLSIDLLAGLTAPGTYVVDVYWRVWGGQFGGCDYFKFDPDDTGSSADTYIPAAFTRAYFDLNITEGFTDGNFSASPAWSGDAANFTVVNNSDVASLNGSEALRSYTLRLNAPAAAQTEHISLPVTSWGGNQEWSFWMGRRNQAATNSNHSTVWLYADQANLEAASISGYRVRLGDDSGGDEINLQVVNAGVATNLISSAEIANGRLDYGVAVRVTRSQAGVWTLFTSPLPVSDGSGANAQACPASSASVLAGSATNNTFVPSGTGYIGVTAAHSTGVNAIAGAEFDNFRFVPIPFDTFVNLASSSAVVNENGGTLGITVNITHPSATAATTVNLVLTGGSAARINGFTAQTLIFPAGSSAPQTVVLTITDNEVCDDTGNLTLQLQAASGGANAYVTAPSQFGLTINDDNTAYTTLLTENFEDGNTDNWTATPSGWWQASNFIPCSGAFSARSGDVNVAGQSAFTADLDDVSMLGVTTTWRFNLRYNNDPSPNNKFQVFLSAGETNLWGSSVDGYAVGVNPLIPGDPDIITLWRVDNGALTAALVTSAIDWGNGAATSEIGFEVIRAENGLWTLRVDQNGDFDNLVTIGSASDAAYDNIRFFGVRYLFTVGLDNALAFDDISITQQGCEAIYYSQGTGLVSDPVWDDVPVGVGGVINPGQYTRLRIQSGHTITQSGPLSTNDITIDSGGSLIASTDEHRVYGNWENNGAYTSSGQVSFKGDENQAILGSSVTTFGNLAIDNEGFTVTAQNPIEVKGGVWPEQGTFDANGNVTLLSTSPAFTAPIGEIKPGADVVGNLTLQRYVPSWTYNGTGVDDGGTWVHLGCPLNGPLTLADWDDDMVTTGFAGSDFPPPYPFVNVRKYNEATPGLRDVGYVNAASVADPMSGGYLVFLPYDAHVLDISGTINKGSYLQPVSYTNTGNGPHDGWNLLANLAPSEMDWVPMVQNGSGVNIYYRFDRDLPGYRAYNGITQAGTASRYIPSGMSFLTYTNGTAANIAYAETYKSNTAQPFDRNLPQSSVLYLGISHDGMGDEALLNLVEGTSAVYEYENDAPKADNDLVPGAPELAFVSEDLVRLTIQSASVTGPQQFPVWIKAPAAGTYTLLVNEAKNLPAGACFTVHDLITGESMVADNGSSLTFSVTEPYTGVRFMVASTASVSTTVSDAACPGAHGEVSWQAEGLWNYDVLNAYGQPVLSGLAGSFNASLAAGTYTLVADRLDDACAASPLTLVVSEPPALGVEAGIVAADCQSENGQIEFAVSHASGYTYSLTAVEGTPAASGSSTDAAIRIDHLPGTVYVLEVADACQSQTTTLDLRDPMAVGLEVLVPLSAVAGEAVEFEMLSVNQDEVSWTLNGQTISSSQVCTHTFEAAGTYGLTAAASNSKCSESVSAQVKVKTAPDKPGPLVQVVAMPEAWSFQLTSVPEATGTLELWNSAGQRVLQHTVSGNRIDIENSSFAAGVYTYRISGMASAVLTGQVVR